jgi:serine/threonine-protein kinase
MDPKRFQETERLFHEALQVPEEDRAAWLHDACEGDDALLDAVSGLLDRADADDTWPRLDEAVRQQIEDARSGDAAATPPDRIGPYRIVRKLGHGGMGIVHLAERTDVGKRVALKLLRTPLATDELRARFDRERRILAQLEHPHIAPLLDAGVTPDGTPYFAMELVEGEPITDYCRRGIDLRGRLDLMLRLCEAVAYAHRHLVVHRDIKPANVLVTHDGRLKLVDFGVAKLLAAVDDEERLSTATRIFTPVYAAPEQVTGQPVTTATDVYQLGALLYELLADVPPFDPDLSPASAMRAITEHQPLPPSAAASGTSDDTTAGGTIARLGRGLRGDLDGIVLKCMDKRPDRRYASVDALTDDLNRYLDGRTVRARPVGPLYQARRFAQRHLVVSGAAIAALFWAGTATLQSIATRRERDRAEAAAAVARIETGKAQAVTDFLVGLFEAGDPGTSRADSITARDILERGVEEASALDDQPDVQATLFAVTGRIHSNLGDHAMAESQLRRSLAIAERLPSADSTLVSRAQYDLAASLVMLDRHAEAVPLLHDVIRQRLAADSSAGLLAHQAFNILHASLHAIGNANEADSVFGEWQRLLENTAVADEELALALKSQGQILGFRGDFERAIPVLRESVAMHRSVYGADHVNYADALDVLAAIYLEAGDIAGADSITEEALALRRTQLAPPHTQLSLSLANRGDALRERGDLAAAEPLLREAVEMERQLGDTASIGFASRNLNLAILLQAREDYEEAETRYRSITGFWSRNYGPDYPLTIMTELRLVDLLHDAGRFDDAADLLVARHRRLTVSPGGGSERYVIQTLRSLVTVYTAADNPEMAEKYRALLPDSLDDRSSIRKPADEASPARHSVQAAGVALMSSQ